MASRAIWVITLAPLLNYGASLNEMCWSEGFRRVLLCSDSIEALSLITRWCEKDHPYAWLVKDIWNPLERDWTVRLQHTGREAIRCADWLARRAQGLSLGTQYLKPNGSNALVNQDREGLGSSSIEPLM